MLHKIVRLVPLTKFRLEIEFEDGIAGVVDLADDLDGPMFESLRDDAFFRQASLDEYGVVCWPNSADYAPDAMRELLIGKRYKANQKAKQAS